MTASIVINDGSGLATERAGSERRRDGGGDGGVVRGERRVGKAAGREVRRVELEERREDFLGEEARMKLGRGELVRGGFGG